MYAKLDYMVNTPDDFLAQIDRDGPLGTLGPCWLWTGGLDAYGYGRFYIWGLTFKAHRFAYELFNKAVPGPSLDHHCHNLDPSCAEEKCFHRRCVNPNHLLSGEQHENMARSAWRNSPPTERL
jgi:hypothetical protein